MAENIVKSVPSGTNTADLTYAPAKTIDITNAPAKQSPDARPKRQLTKRPARKYWITPTGEELQETMDRMTNQLVGWMVEREKVAIRRGSGLVWERWSEDPIMLIFRFCNVRRECDRVTRAVIDNFKRT